MNIRQTALLLAAAVALASSQLAEGASCTVKTSAPAATTSAPVATTSTPTVTTATTTTAPAATTAAPAATTAPSEGSDVGAEESGEDDDEYSSTTTSTAASSTDETDTTTSSTTSSTASSTASSTTSSSATDTTTASSSADETTTSTASSTDSSAAEDADTTTAASTASSGASTTTSSSGTSGLNDYASAAGKYMGTASDINSGDSYYTAELANAHDWGMVTPGNAMKWDSTEPTQNTFSYTKADAFVEVVEAAGMKVRCHTLCWYQQVPSWVQSLGKEDLLSALENHVTEVMTHFGDTCYAWDVVNEALAEDGSYRSSFWYTTTGTEYITTAFKAANAVKESLGLSTKLYYNDYNTDSVNSKSTAALALAQMLLDANITIDGMGFQSHLTSGSVASTADQVTNLERFTAIGLDVAITEMDVKVGTSSPTDAQLEQQATDYANTIAACKQVDGCVGVTVWDFSDQYSWISDDAPLPFDQPSGTGTAVEQKPAYDSILSAWKD